MVSRHRRWRTALGALAITVLACGPGENKASEAHDDTDAKEGVEELSAFELENGIGPIKEAVVLGPLDPRLAAQGEQIFSGKCGACHKMKEKYVGPALGQVTQRRTPAYVMNMILDPEEMYERHPVAQQLLAEHMTQMPNLGLTQDEARAVVEYLRSQAEPTSP